MEIEVSEERHGDADDYVDEPRPSDQCFRFTLVPVGVVLEME